MQRVIMKSKIHRATVTRANVDFEGSCGIAAELLRASDIVPGEQVHVVNATNGSRAVTYAIEGAPGEITLNGAMAHLGSAGDVVILITYAQFDENELRDFTPTIVRVDAHNRIREQAAIA
ncbi:MAG TPA: aspartate 1-decarboxylase [Candidatus Dormibacteraeota bacterium]